MDSIFEPLDVPTIREEYFASDFAKQLLTDITPAVIEKWLQVAVYPTASVNVVDAAGNMLFRVPPVGYQPDMTSVHISALMEQVELHNQRIPGSGSALMKQYMGKIADNTIPEDDKLAWDVIRARYGGGIMPEEVISKDVTVKDDDW